MMVKNSKKMNVRYSGLAAHTTLAAQTRHIIGKMKRAKNMNISRVHNAKSNFLFCVTNID
jgi:hypothetical protein